MKKKLLRGRFVFCFLIFFYWISSAAEIETATIPGTKTGVKQEAVIILPNNYKYQDKKYPVLYLLHGHGGNESSYIRSIPSLPEFADDNHFIIVCPNGGFNSWYMDSPFDKFSQFESHIIDELIPYVDSTYPTLANRNGRAITGLSMGGHGALYLAIRHQEVFGAAGSMSGGVDLRYDTNAWEIKEKIGNYADHPDLWIKNSVIEMVRNLKNKDLELIIDCGVDDFFFAINSELHQRLLKFGIEHDYISRPGNHSWQYWRKSIKYQVLFFSEYFASRKLE